MSNSSTPLRLLGIVGSLRRNSYSQAILNGLAERLPEGVALEMRDVRLPLYDQDEDGPNTPSSVKDFRDAIAASDAVLLVTPEFNYGVPGPLKNALDWASRPYGKSALIGKPYLVISQSPAFTGGVRAQAQLNETMLGIQAVPVPGPQVVIGLIADKVRDGMLVDEPSLAFVRAALDRLVTSLRR